ncbi:hypothetical protein HMPREF0765_4469 [Sphingobacterium spiritivorum ATCC 33300]|uniref:Uncharacterized protein n=1 Tax=Sphingobacterium spiritivorum ATCC 33300 TaxID=525372 RepID=C2G4G3_SPHSI|nr:hypothetical protein [Sphingobacterium spiritivorum]EEI89964.1 hypothetical protein HMPREF0765_4469 [Sphingobacterium spiritivorum ATCC 33300]QQS94885.1 hypothetical protein I6J03_16095 [Sphingobacterium spiritivorum]
MVIPIFFECVELFNKSQLSVSYWKDEENWMTLSNESNVIAYIWHKYPLIFVDEKFITMVKDVITDQNNLILISASDLNQNIFKVEEEFHLIDFEFGFNKMSFSAEDFWYYTNDTV